MDKEHGRIVFVSSWTHDPHHEMNNTHIITEDHKTIIKSDIDDWARPKADETGDEWKAGMRRYGASKTLLVNFA